MPRANRRRREEARPLTALAGSITATQRFGGREYAVRRVAGNAPGTWYRCPGCEQEVDGGVPHVVVWPADGVRGLEDRRHWHSGCWSARDRRSPGGPRG